MCKADRTAGSVECPDNSRRDTEGGAVHDDSDVESEAPASAADMHAARRSHNSVDIGEFANFQLTTAYRS